MSSEWLKVMLDEIARKKAEAEQDRIETELRRGADERSADERSAQEAPRTRGDDVVESS